MVQIDSTVPLTVALLAALKGDADTASIAAARVYDAVPARATKPYVQVGSQVQVLPEQADCYDAAIVYITVSGFSAGPGTLEVKKLGRAVVAALHGQEIALSDNQRLVNIRLDDMRYLRDPDGLSQQVTCTFMAQTEPTA